MTIERTCNTTLRVRLVHTLYISCYGMTIDDTDQSRLNAVSKVYINSPTFAISVHLTTRTDPWTAGGISISTPHGQSWSSADEHSKELLNSSLHDVGCV
jgi:hypothetical protein